ncbi:MAG: hypothetical protein JXA78_16205 [Anaerolineales bacterium]|nr:hypothetical protein [Anaerolineales bacterium]
MKGSFWARLGLVALFLCAVMGCARAEQETPAASSPQKVYRPPTVAPEMTLGVVLQPSSTPILTPTPKEARPTATPDCVDDLRFLEDLTFPDGARVAPGELVDKRWLVENAGTCNWDRRYRLRLVEGIDLQAPEEQALYPARSGTRAVIRVQFRAPDERGRYRSAWQAYDPQGQAFGDLIYVEIVVRP